MYARGEDRLVRANVPETLFNGFDDIHKDQDIHYQLLCYGIGTVENLISINRMYNATAFATTTAAALP